VALTRRDFFRVSAGAAAGTAVGGLVGLGIDLSPAVARAQELRIKDARAVPSVCPYCAVGCGTVVHTVEGSVVNIEGDPKSPLNEGTLCPKGAAIYQLHVNPNRATRVLHRAPGATEWEVWGLERAMDRVAELVKKTRDETFVERAADGRTVNHTLAICSLGGAALDNEWNHIHQKLLRALGVVAIENQTRVGHAPSVSALGVRLGCGAATTFPRNLAEADCIVIEGSNMAECHPVAFRWVTQAKLRGATIIHVDPRFTRTSAAADLYASIRAGSDIAFLGGLINYVIQHEKYFRDYVVHYTNAAVLVREDFKDTEDLDGVFSGLMPYAGDPLDGSIGQYDAASWQYERSKAGPRGERSPAARAPFEALVRANRQPAPLRDPTLAHPRSVFQVLKRHFSRYTPEMVERVTGCPTATFFRVAEAITANSGPDRTTAFCFAAGLAQHTYGPQAISCGALLQLLLGNVGRPGGGILALRGHATDQGATDLPTLYHSIHGYMSAPSSLKRHETLADYIRTETPATSSWAQLPKFIVSYLKSMYGPAATKDNDFGYGWHPRISGDHSYLPTMVAMAEGRVRGLFAMGQNPAVGGPNAGMQRRALANLEWLVVKDNFETETAAFWYNSPEVRSGELKTADIRTEVFLFPSAQVAERDGSFTNTQRLVQWHHKAADPPGDCRSDTWFTYHLGTRLKRSYAGSARPQDQGVAALAWDYDPINPSPNSRIKDEPDVLKILRELNGYDTASGDHLRNVAELRDDGSTTCASWIYCGVFPAPGQNRAASHIPDPPGGPDTHLGWGYAWPANRRLLYNRASARPDGRPWSERKKYVWWDGRKWTGRDVPDFPPTKAPTTPAKLDATGLEAHSGADPFSMKPDGKGWLFAPTGLVDGPLPTHYEPAESPVPNPLYRQQASPVLKYWKRRDNLLAAVADSRFPLVLTTYRLTEHHLSGGMSRWLPWLTELQPELFVELSPDLAAGKGIRNLDGVLVRTPRGSARVKALVTRRLRPLTIDGRTVHQVGLPWHWGYQGVVTGDVANNLSALVGDPNTSTPEGKAFVCNVEKL
jgi:formate dehydrogenase major subunit